MFVTSLGLLSWFGISSIRLPNHSANAPTKITTLSFTSDTPCLTRRVLDGKCVSDKEKKSESIVAAIIDNHPEARPQLGLAQASVVYEAPVEANYTRFLALYPLSDELSQVGPVRSARPYYLDWVAEYQALFMHVGGSPQALDLLSERSVVDVNEFYRGWYFWRSDSKSAPYNVYTKSNLWKKAWNDYAVTSSVPVVSWNFSEKPWCEGECTYEKIQSIEILFSSPNFEVTWKYNTTTNQYVRYQGSAVHTDETGEPIVADTIIVQSVQTKIIDTIGRLSIATVGEGKVQVLRDGWLGKGKWQKTSPESRTQWLWSESLQPIPIKPGKIWIEVLPQNGSWSID